MKIATKICRVFALLMCVCMLVTSMGGAFVPRAYAEATVSTVDRKADGATLNDYKDQLITAKDTRNAGRVWTDKTVVANGGSGITMTVDGKAITSEEDFLTVFSAMSSTISETIDVPTPLDVVFVLDISGSMTNNADGTTWGVKAPETRFYALIDALNKAMRMLMGDDKDFKTSPYNRMGLVTFGDYIYGGSSNSKSSDVSLPLDHYIKSASSDVYFTVPSKATVYSLWAEAQDFKSEKGNKTYDKTSIIRAQGQTYAQGGLYAGMSMLAGVDANDTYIVVDADGKRLNKTVAGDGETKVQRQPVIIFMSDGEPNKVASDNNWWDDPLPNEPVSFRNDNSNATFQLRAGMAMLTMATAAYWKQEINKKYFSDENGNYADKTKVATIGLLLPKGEVPRSLAETVLDPQGHWSETNGVPSFVKSYWEQYTQENNASVSVNLGFKENVYNTISFYDFGHPPKDDITSLLYVNQYIPVDDLDKLSEAFAQIIQSVGTMQADLPISGTNDSGTEDALDFEDPIGWYMDVKNVTDVLLFGERYAVKPAEGKRVPAGYTTSATCTSYQIDPNVQLRTITNPSYGEDSSVTFSLDDIYIWVEESDTGEKKGSASGITGNYSEELHIHIPSTALPAQVAKVALSGDTVKEYSDNINEAKVTPLRVFYEVGFSDDYKTNGAVDIRKVLDSEGGPSYVAKNTDAAGNVRFYTNYFTGDAYDPSNGNFNGTYGDDVTVHGNAAVTFSPSDKNRYYQFQKNLKVYSSIPGVSAPLDAGNGKEVSPEALEKATAVTDVTAMTDDAEYYIVIEYYAKSGSDARKVYLALPRTTEDFSYSFTNAGGSGGDWDGNLDYLTYYNTQTGASSAVYSGNRLQPTPEGEGWVVATKVGGVRQTRLESINQKKASNVTGTAPTYYMPVYSANTASDNVRVTAYQGNNGYLSANSGSLVVRKDLKDGSPDYIYHRQDEFQYELKLTGDWIQSARDGAVLNGLKYVDTDAADYVGEYPANTGWKPLIKKATADTTKIAGEYFLLASGLNMTPVIKIEGASYRVNAGSASPRLTWVQDDGAVYGVVNVTLERYPAGAGDLADYALRVIKIDQAAAVTQVSYETTQGETVSFANTIEYDHSELTITKESQNTATARFKLSAGEYIAINNLPAGTSYTVKEILGTDQSYALDEIKANYGSVNRDKANATASGTIDGNELHHRVEFCNEFKEFDLIIRKQTEASEGTEINDLDKERVFEFTLSLTAPGSTTPLDGPFGYVVTGDRAKEGVLWAADPGDGRYDEATDLLRGADGAWKFELKQGETFKVIGVPMNTGYSYAIQEAEAVGYVPEDDSVMTGRVEGDTSLSIVDPNNLEPVDIKNLKLKPTPVAVSLNAVKSVQGDGAPGIEAGQYSFTVTPDGANPNDPIKQAKTVANADPADGGALIRLFENVEYDTVGEYGYTVAEVAGNVPGMRYDETSHAVRIVVEEEYAGTPKVYTGKLKATVYVDDQLVAETTGEAETAIESGVVFTNVFTRPGSLTITKAIVGGGTDANGKTYRFTVTGPADVQGKTYGDVSFDENGAATVAITGADSVTISNLPEGTYSVTEDREAAAIDGYTLTVTGEGTANVTGENGAAVTVTNTYTEDQPTPPETPTGSLTIAKAIVGGGTDASGKAYRFTVTGPADVQGKTYGGVSFGADGTATVVITGASSVTISGLPEGTYSVTEDRAAAAIDGYTLTVTGEGAANVTGENGAAVTVTNTYTEDQPTPPETPTGMLTVAKAIVGGGTEAGGKTYRFTIMGPADVKGKTYGSVSFDANGRATVAITGANSLSISGLPEGVYSVAEDRVAAAIDGYTLTVTGEGTANVTGKNGTAVTVTNTYTENQPAPTETPTGSLTVAKTVAGADGDVTSEFNFMIMLSDRSVNGVYGDVTFKDGVASFTLRHGEKKTVTGLPAGTAYSVSELGASQNGYDVISTGATGTIQAGKTAAASFINTRESIDVPQTGDNGHPELWFILALVSIIALSTFHSKRAWRKR